MERMVGSMPWTGIATTVENEVIIANEDIKLLDEIKEYDFDVFVKVYNVTPHEMNLLKEGNYDFQIKFQSLRSITLQPFERSFKAIELSEIYKRRIQHLNNARGRFEHAFNKHKSFVSQQQYIYSLKVDQAKEMLRTKVILDNFVTDYAEESGLDPLTAANLIVEKHNGQSEYLRKIERLRLRHFAAIKKARTIKDFEIANAALDKDFFINMLL